MLGIGGAGAMNGVDVYELLRNAAFLVLCIIACLPAPKRWFYKQLADRPRRTAMCANTAAMCTLVLCVAYLVNSAYNPFLYFRF